MRVPSFRHVAAPLAAVISLSASPAWADESGGAAGPVPVGVSAAVCSTGAHWSCARGRKLTLKGDGLDAVTRVTFLGGRGRADNSVARPVAAQGTRLTVVVPAAARTGRLLVHSVSAGDTPAPRAVSIVAATGVSHVGSGGTAATSTGSRSGGTFPIDGHHDMGQTPTNGFGGGRGHQGQDLFASCGTPLVAVLDATVQQATYQSRAGYYVVLQDAAGRSYVYMHLRTAALVKNGQRVVEGQRIGFVGDTGDADGCHLHFELWTAPGWYTGGHAIDPLPQLKAWHADDGDH